MALAASFAIGGVYFTPLPKQNRQTPEPLQKLQLDLLPTAPNPG